MAKKTVIVTRTRDLRDNPELIAAGFELYCDGLSVAKVFERLKPEWPGLSRRTMERIAAENDWVNARASVKTKKQDQVASSETLLQDVVNSLTTLKQSLDARLTKLNFQEQAQYQRICEQLLTLQGVHPNQKNGAGITEEDVKKLFQVIERHKVIGPIWKKHKSEILTAFKKARK